MIILVLQKIAKSQCIELIIDALIPSISLVSFETFPAKQKITSIYVKDDVYITIFKKKTTEILIQAVAFSRKLILNRVKV